LHPAFALNGKRKSGQKVNLLNFNLSRIPAEARIEIISTRSSGRESAQIEF
jgi:hypothetical protein